MGNYRFSVGRVDYIEDESSRKAIIIAVVVGATVLLVTVVIVTACCVSRKRNKRLRKEFEKQQRMNIALQNTEMPTLKKR